MPDELPDGWVRTSLGAVCQVVGGATPDTHDPSLWGDEVAWLTPADLASTRARRVGRGARGLTRKGYDGCSAQLMPAGSLLFSSRAPIGYLAVTTSELCTNQGFKSLVPAVGVNVNYLYWYMASVTDQVKKMASGTTFAEVSGKVVASVPLLLPPTAEQERIAAKLDDAYEKFAGVRKSLESIRARASALRQALLVAAVRGQVASQVVGSAEASSDFEILNLLSKRGKQPLPSEDWDLPAGWVLAEVGDLFEVGVGQTPSRTEPGYWNGEIPWVSSGEVAFNRIAKTREQITAAGLGNADRRLHPPGTVLLAMIGEGKTRGQAAILDVEAAHNQNCASIRVSESEVLPEWVYYCLVERYARSRLLGSGNNQPAMNKKLVQSIPLPMPPVATQHALVEWLDEKTTMLLAAEEACALLAERVDALWGQTLRSGVSGHLTAQSPDDESAEQLLARIADDRATGGRARRKSSTAPKARAARATKTQESVA